MRFFIIIGFLTIILPLIAGYVAGYFEHGYDQAEVTQLNNLIESATAEDYVSQLEVALYLNGGKL